MSKTEITESWQLFTLTFANTILPIYETHEQTFDYWGYHGRRHLTRSVLFAEIMSRFYHQHVEEKTLDVEGIRIAVSFHDSGREGNGRDYWEAESAQNCFDYLIKQGKNVSYAQQVSKTILDKKKDISNRLSQIIYDADVLEIMRLFIDHENGINQFRTAELYFLGANALHPSLAPALSSLRTAFIQEAWQFIRRTEHLADDLNNADFLPFYLNHLQTNQTQYPLMNRFFEFDVV